MVEKEILKLILQGIPGSFVLVIFCFVFLDLRLRWKQIGVIALLSIVDLVEVLPWPFGIPAIVLMLALAVLIKIFTGKELSKIFLGVFSLALVDTAGDFI